MTCIYMYFYISILVIGVLFMYYHYCGYLLWNALQLDFYKILVNTHWNVELSYAASELCWRVDVQVLRITQ